MSSVGDGLGVESGLLNCTPIDQCLCLPMKSKIYPSFKSTLPYLSEFLCLALHDLFRMSHVALPYVCLHNLLLYHDISQYIILPHRSRALFRIVYGITSQLDRALAGMSTTGEYLCSILLYAV